MAKEIFMDQYNLGVLGIHELRDLANVLGVKSPTTKNSDQLKEAISDILEGRAEPYVRPNKKGRPLKHNTNSFMRNENFIPTLEKLGRELSVPYQCKDEDYDWSVAMPHAMYTACIDDKLDDCDGVVETTKAGFGWLRQDDCKKRKDDIYISPVLIKQHSLKSGDYVSGKSKWLSNDKPRAMVEVTFANNNKPYFFESSSIGLGKTYTNSFVGEYQLGGKYILSFPESSRQSTYFEDVCKSFVGDGVEICAIKLNADINIVSDLPNIIYIPFDLDDDQASSMTNLYFERFKRKMEEGKNLVVVIDSLTKYTKSVNAVTTNNVIHQEVSPKTLLAVKQLVGIAKCISTDASITLVDIEGDIKPESIKQFFDCEIKPLFNIF